jgi:hemolysin activation/secretion protein
MRTNNYMHRKTFSLLALCALVAIARGQSIPDAGRISRETREPERQEPAPVAPEVQASTGPALADADTGPKVTVRKITVTGATLLPAATLEERVADLVGQPATVGQLRAAAARVTDAYREAGFLFARAYLPQQDVTEGDIQISVLEGRVGDIQVNAQPGVRVDEELVKSILEQAKSRGTSVRDADLERGLLLLGELAGVSASTVLVPGDEVGSARVAVDLAPTALVEGRVNVDNHGSRYSGDWRLGAEARVNGGFGRGEVISVNGMVSDDAGLKSGGLNASLPLAPGWTLRGGASHLEYDLGGDFSPLGVNGEVTDYSVGTGWAWIRNRRTRATVSLDAAQRELRDRIDAFGTDNDRGISTLTLRLSGTHSDGWMGGGLTGFSAGFTAGDLGLDSALQRSIDQGPGGYDTEGAFQRLNVSVWRNQQIHEGFSAFASVRAQFAPSGNLDSSEKSLVGGPQGVRAFPVSEAAGDESVQASVELRYETRPWNVPARVFAFYDFGHASLRADPNPADGDNDRDLGAVGVGVYANPTPNTEITLTVAHANEASLEDAGSSRTRAFVSASWGF